MLPVGSYLVMEGRAAWRLTRVGCWRVGWGNAPLDINPQWLILLNVNGCHSLYHYYFRVHPLFGVSLSLLFSIIIILVSIFSCVNGCLLLCSPHTGRRPGSCEATWAMDTAALVSVTVCLCVCSGTVCVCVLDVTVSVSVITQCLVLCHASLFIRDALPWLGLFMSRTRL